MAGPRVHLCASSSFSLGLLQYKPSLSTAAVLINKPIKRYSSGRHDGVEDERAPSTAQEFVRVAEERLRHEEEEEEEEEEEGFPVSETVKTVYEGPEESVAGDSFKEDDNKPQD